MISKSDESSPRGMNTLDQDLRTENPKKKKRKKDSVHKSTVP